MRGFHKSKRVTWASDVNLCQVMLFLSEEAPFQVSLGAQDHLQAKASWASPHSAGPASDDALPPGFEAPQVSHQYRIHLSEIPLVRWRCPKRIVPNPAWRVVAGEENEEAEVQGQREMRVLEAVYPRESSIPQNPVYSVDSEEFHQSDLQIPSIPITPIEDEDMSSADASYSYGAAMTSQPPQVAPGIPWPSRITDERSGPEMARGLEPDVAAAASAAFTAIMKSNEHGSSIDQGLLIQILTNPKMIEKLVTDYGTGAVTMQNMSGPVTAPLPAPHPVGGAPTVNGPFASQQNGPNPRFPPPAFSPAPSQPTVRPPPPPPPARDMNYYKNLIQQHGGERQEFAAPQYGNIRPDPAIPNNSNNGPRPRDMKGKIMKPCIYFNSSRGCRNGANCSYQHDSSMQPQGNSMGDQSSKRMKLDREITGT